MDSSVVITMKLLVADKTAGRRASCLPSSILWYQELLVWDDYKRQQNTVVVVATHGALCICDI